MASWLVKQEPTGDGGYPFAKFLADKKTVWSGIRNYQARNNLRAMKKADAVFYYHSNQGREIVGLAEVSKEAFADPIAGPNDGDWSAVELRAIRPLDKPLSLEQIKSHPVLKNMILVKNSRLSVMPVTDAQASEILRLTT
jgi:predicted RNA-binding protein with PUA-like domain